MKNLDATDPPPQLGRKVLPHPDLRDDDECWIKVPDRPSWIEYNTRTGMWRNNRATPP